MRISQIAVLASVGTLVGCGGGGDGGGRQPCRRRRDRRRSDRHLNLGANTRTLTGGSVEFGFNADGAFEKERLNPTLVRQEHSAS